MFNFADTMEKARRVVHTTFADYAEYFDASLSVPVQVTVRWHDRMMLQGDLVDAGYADIIEGVTRLIFNREELAEKNVVLNRGGTVTFGEKYDNAVLILDSQEPIDGPINLVWKSAKK